MTHGERNYKENSALSSLYVCRYACAIEMPDRVIVTGGLYTPNQVILFGKFCVHVCLK